MIYDGSFFLVLIKGLHPRWHLAQLRIESPDKILILLLKLRLLIFFLILPLDLVAPLAILPPLHSLVILLIPNLKPPIKISDPLDLPIPELLHSLGLLPNLLAERERQLEDVQHAVIVADGQDIVDVGVEADRVEADCRHLVLDGAFVGLVQEVPDVQVAVTAAYEDHAWPGPAPAPAGQVGSLRDQHALEERHLQPVLPDTEIVIVDGQDYVLVEGAHVEGYYWPVRPLFVPELQHVVVAAVVAGLQGPV
jgi:hypothetical protein